MGFYVEEYVTEGGYEGWQVVRSHVSWATAKGMVELRSDRRAGRMESPSWDTEERGAFGM